MTILNINSIINNGATHKHKINNNMDTMTAQVEDENKMGKNLIMKDKEHRESTNENNNICLNTKNNLSNFSVASLLSNNTRTEHRHDSASSPDRDYSRTIPGDRSRSVSPTSRRRYSNSSPKPMSPHRRSSLDDEEYDDQSDVDDDVSIDVEDCSQIPRSPHSDRPLSQNSNTSRSPPPSHPPNLNSLLIQQSANNLMVARFMQAAGAGGATPIRPIPYSALAAAGLSSPWNHPGHFSSSHHSLFNNFHSGLSGSPGKTVSNLLITSIKLFSSFNFLKDGRRLYV
ncbi:hypothetical protein M8J76_000150 [Diaphorina citri]|nr:hypothetical protein M8J75_006514 [Diaphorina citri]KAI5713475.1 hypothetical protein M8J76_000150 [Diaphorina citri]KAI5714673.1 hypothetical protein M8J77_003504 [Diaphorina citri]